MEVTYLVENIKRCCKQNGITTAELEKKLGFSVGLISRWARAMPSLDKVIMVAEYFKVPLDQLLKRPELKGNDRFLALLQMVTEKGDKRIDWKYLESSNPMYHNIAALVDINENDIFACDFNEGKFLLVKDKSEEIWKFYIVPDENSGPVQREAEEEDVEVLGEFVKKLCYEKGNKEKANRLVEKFVDMYDMTN